MVRLNQIRKKTAPLHDRDRRISRRVAPDYPCPVCTQPPLCHPQFGWCTYKSRSGIPGDDISTILRELCDGSVVEEYPRR